MEPESGSAGVFQHVDSCVMIRREKENQIWVFYGDLYWNTSRRRSLIFRSLASVIASV